MPKFRRFKCYDCRIEIDCDFPDNEEIPRDLNCKCGGIMKQMLCRSFYVDHWTPMTNNAQLDIEHFEKKAVKNGKYVSRKSMYSEDRAKQNIPMNLSEV